VAYERHERAVERKLDRIIELLEMQNKMLIGMIASEMIE
tara:strand:- start:1319 stop:1435 length:117 start_codon:yes stop_codon:yes gene_type:complete